MSDNKQTSSVNSRKEFKISSNDRELLNRL